MDKKVFISYSHADAEFAKQLAEALNSNGVKVWYDKWDIQPGDSIVRKIFEEGLATAQLFVVVLSKTSVLSDWVREELDVATVLRVEKVTRVIAVVKEDCEIPVSLRARLRVDMRRDFQAGIQQLVNLYFGTSQRPPLGEPPAFVSKLKQIAGMSARGERGVFPGDG